MTRQEAYIAELSQLLFYMTAWDKAEVLKGITAMVNHPETGLKTMEELGTPMKLAVTLHRQYEPTPEPTPEELAAKAAAREAALAAAEEAFAAEEAAEAEDTIEEASETVEAVEAVTEAEEAVEEVVEAEEAVEAVIEAEEAVEAVTETVEAVEEEAKKETVESINYVERPGQEKIFAEIFNAATEAQSAVQQEEPKKETVRKARYWFLIPYIALAVVIGVPATVICAVANVGVLAATLVSLSAVVYMVIFPLMGAAVLSSQLIILGLTLLMLLVTILLGAMTGWFLRNATIGFPQFLIEIAKRYGYREVEVQ